MFDTISYQDKPVTRLLTMFTNNTVPHALLFSGAEGSGKHSVAVATSMLMNCRAPVIPDLSSGEMQADFKSAVCGECLPCRKIMTGSHPDLISIEPTGNLIRIARIRELCSTLLTKPYEATVRTVIINKAEKMNNEASNALLKVLEEPPENTLFILTAQQGSDLLPTIVSRCQHVQFKPHSHDSILKLIIAEHKTDPKTAEIIASISNGNLARAMELSSKSAKCDNLAMTRHWITDELLSLKNSTSETPLLFAEHLASRKESLPEILEIMLTLIRDLMIYKFCPDKLINRDMTEIIDTLSEKFSVRALLEIIRQIQIARKSISANAALRLTLETMALNISRVK